MSEVLVLSAALPDVMAAQLNADYAVTGMVDRDWGLVITREAVKIQA